MDSGSLAPGESWVQCPYNASHMILNKKQITHLDKCRKQFEKDERAKGRKVEIGSCRFNYSHRIHKPEIPIHESQCPDQYSVLHSVVTGPVGNSTENDVDAKRPQSTGDGCKTVWDTEDWDAEAAEGVQRGYDPSIKMKEGCYFYLKPGLTKSERNAAREESRLKWLEMEAQQEAAARAAPPSNYEEWDENA